MKTSDFEYPLPRELIAQQPAPDRAGSRMLIVHRDTGMLDHRQVADLPDLLQPGDLLVVNDTRVIPARLFGRKARTGGQVEVLLIEELIDSAREPAVVRHGMTQRRTPPRLRSGLRRTSLSRTASFFAIANINLRIFFIFIPLFSLY